MPGSAIFISYRRADTGGYAARLRDHLVPSFGQGRLFLDVRIPPGTRWRDAIDQALRASGAVLAVMGPNWLTPRLEDADDTLRQELEMAFALGVPVIPVLIGVTAMPTAEQLPPSLRPLAGLQAHRLTDEGWDDGVRRLVMALQQLQPSPPVQPGSWRPPPPPKSSVLRRLAVVTTVVVVLAIMVGGGIWTFQILLDILGFNAKITLSPTSGRPGTTITVNGTRFPANADVTLWILGPAGETRSEGDGTFTIGIDVPTGTSFTGITEVVARSGASADTAPFTVTR